jgi:predicted glycosyltransferase
VIARPPLLLYCQHSLGLGHLKRSWALAEQLAEVFQVTLISGGAPPAGLTPPAAIETIEVAPLAQDASGRLIPLHAADSIDEVKRRRVTLLLETYRRLQPHVVVIELFPFGRRKFHDEIVALLDETRREPRPVVATSVRDLLVDRGADQQKHDDRARDIVNAYFDLVLVHTDPKFATLDDTFRPTRTITVPVHHTGFVVAERRGDAAAARRSGILVSGGGGRFAERLYRSALQAHALLEPPAPMTIVAGPLCPPEMVAELERLAQPGVVSIESTVADLCGAMRCAEVSVSQCGYNTALDIVRAGVPAIVVPFDDNGDNEQTVRAERLARLGALRVVRASQGARALAAAIDAARRTTALQPSLDLGGAERSTSILLSTLAERRARLPGAEPV